jgi:hypothetical protein
VLQTNVDVGVTIDAFAGLKVAACANLVILAVVAQRSLFECSCVLAFTNGLTCWYFCDIPKAPSVALLPDCARSVAT